MNITSNRVDDVITLDIEGRVDTNTSSALQMEILNSFQKTSKLVLDFQQVVYVSSAGLRALLIGQKTAMSKKGSMVLINVPDVVKNVLDMSGFSNILTIQ